MSEENISDLLSNFIAESPELSLPSKCNGCKTSPICGPVDAFVNLSKLGIQLEISKCPYFK